MLNDDDGHTHTPRRVARVYAHATLCFHAFSQVQFNHTYPCWSAAHGATHVYLHVQPPAIKMAAVELFTVGLLGVALLALAALLSAHPSVQQKLLHCCRHHGCDPSAEDDDDAPHPSQHTRYWRLPEWTSLGGSVARDDTLERLASKHGVV